MGKGSVLAEQNQALLNQVTQLTSQYVQLTILLTTSASPAIPAAQSQPEAAAQTPAVASPPGRKSYATHPEPLTGDFLQYRKVFCQRPLTFATDIMKMWYVLRLLWSRARAWA